MNFIADSMSGEIAKRDSARRQAAEQNNVVNKLTDMAERVQEKRDTNKGAGSQSRT